MSPLAVIKHFFFMGGVPLLKWFFSPTEWHDQAHLLPFQLRSRTRGAEAIFLLHSQNRLDPPSRQSTIYVSLSFWPFCPSPLFFIGPTNPSTCEFLHLPRAAHQHLFPWLLIIPKKHNIQESWLCSVLCTLDFESGAAAAVDRHGGIRQRHWNQPMCKPIWPKSITNNLLGVHSISKPPSNLLEFLGYVHQIT